MRKRPHRRRRRCTAAQRDELAPFPPKCIRSLAGHEHSASISDCSLSVSGPRLSFASRPAPGPGDYHHPINVTLLNVLWRVSKLKLADSAFADCKLIGHNWHRHYSITSSARASSRPDGIRDRQPETESRSIRERRPHCFLHSPSA